MCLEDDQMNVLDHDALGATIRLDGRELLVMMALIQEGRLSFECESETGEALDNLVSHAVRLVGTARMDSMNRTLAH
jgi:hypothetical protein